MKNFTRINYLVLVFGLVGFNLVTQAAEIKNCRLSQNTVLRMRDETINAGSLAVLRDGTPVSLNDILGDAMIYFKDQNGKMSESYQWMYNPINKVENRADKYLSSSYGEDVIITVGHFADAPGQASIKYQGTSSGNYLNLICER